MALPTPVTTSVMRSESGSTRIPNGIVNPGSEIQGMDHSSGSAAGWWQQSISQSIENFFGSDSLSIAVMVLVFGMIIAYITSEPKEGQGLSGKKLGIDFEKLFKK